MKFLISAALFAATAIGAPVDQSQTPSITAVSIDYMPPFLPVDEPGVFETYSGTKEKRAAGLVKRATLTVDVYASEQFQIQAIDVWTDLTLLDSNFGGRHEGLITNST